MTQPRSDGVIRGADGVVNRDLDEEDDPLCDVRHMLDRLYADETGSDGDRIELISQVLLAGMDRFVSRPRPY